jgi:MarR family transcriptional regulator, negative regulator of the multidrug operon emrRAB
VKRSQIDNLLGALVLKTHDALTLDFGRLGLRTATDAATLILLLQSDSASISALADVLELSHSSTVRVVDRLEKRQLVSRSRQDDDARSVRLRLTKKGHALATAALGARERTLRLLLSALSAEELRQFGESLTKVLVTATTDRMAADRLCRWCDETVCTRESCPVEQRAVLLSGMSS